MKAFDVWLTFLDRFLISPPLLAGRVRGESMEKAAKQIGLPVRVHTDKAPRFGHSLPPRFEYLLVEVRGSTDDGRESLTVASLTGWETEIEPDLAYSRIVIVT